MKQLKGSFIGKDKRIGIVASRFNEFISNELVNGCVDTLRKAEVTEDDISVFWVPGSFEIPQMLKQIDTENFDALIALGVLIRGDTPHFDYIASEVSKGVAAVGMKSPIPVIFGIITADSVEQAIERAGTKQGNKGRDAALTALEMSNLYTAL